MMGLIGALVCVVATRVLQISRAERSLALIFLVYLWVPAVASPAPISMGAIVVLLVSSATALSRLLGKEDPGRGLPMWIYVGFMMLVASSLLLTQAGTGSTRLPLQVDLLVAPGLLFILVARSVVSNRLSLDRIAVFLVANAILESLVALAQFLTKSAVLYGAAYARQSWAGDLIGNRALGTLDHPLVLSLVLTSILPLLALIPARSVILWFGFIAIPVGILTTGSRTGLVLAVAGLVFVAFQHSGSRRLRLVLIVSTCILVSTLARTVFADLVESRIRDDGGSELTRRLIFQFASRRGDDFLGLGGGLGSNFGVAQAAGLTSSFEYPILIFALELGVVSVVCISIFQLVVCFRAMLLKPVRVWGASVSVAVLGASTFSGVATQSAAAPLVWILLGVAYGALNVRRVGGRALSRKGVTAASSHLVT